MVDAPDKNCPVRRGSALLVGVFLVFPQKHASVDLPGVGTQCVTACRSRCASREAQPEGEIQSGSNSVERSQTLDLPDLFQSNIGQREVAFSCEPRARNSGLVADGHAFIKSP